MASSETRRAGSSRTASEETPRLVCERWELIETALPLGADIPVSESLFSVGNGHVCVRGYAEESDVAVPYSRNAGGNGGSYNSNSGGGDGRRRTMAKAGRPSLAVNAQAPKHGLRGTYVNGTYEERLLTSHLRAFTVGTCVRECFLIRVPDAFCIDVFVGSEHVSAETGTIVSHSRVLDLRTGELRRRMVWLSANQGREVTIESARFVSATQKCIAAVRYAVTAKNVLNTDIRIVSRTAVPAETQQHLKIENVVTRHTLHDASTAVCVRTRNSCKRLVVAATEACSTVQIEHKSQSKSAFTGGSGASIAVSVSPPNHSQQEMVSNLKRSANTPTTSTNPSPSAQQLPQKDQLQQQQKPVTFLAPKCEETDIGAETIYTSVISDSTRIELIKCVAFLSDDDAAPEDICDLAIHQARTAATATYDTLFKEQQCAVSKFWEVGGVHIKSGNPAMQGALRFNMLHLYMSAGRVCLQGSPPRGLMNELYGGLHQWDVDAFIIPFFSHVHPETARALLQFRIDTLPQARNLAADMDLPRGALYPLRTVNGGENSPASFCAAFLHVNAVVAYAIKQYFVASDDISVLLHGGADVVFSTVLIWIIWGTWDKGQFHIRSVGGPDNYSGLSDNDLFTNLMAQFHMQWAVQLAAFLQEKYPVEWEALKERCQFTDEDLVMIERAAAKMVVFFDAKNRVHPVDQFFMRKKKWGFGDLKANRGGPLIRKYDPSVIYRHQVCRTPEVVLASLLLPEKFTRDEKHANYIFYECITTNDSSLSPTIFSSIASQLGILDKALFHLKHAFFIDIDNVVGNTGRGLNSSAAAGSWWALAAGLGGMKVLQGVLHFNPVLPDEWEEYQFYARHHGCLIKVLVTRRTVTYTMMEALNDNNKLLIIHSDTNRIHLLKGIPESVRLFRDVRVFDFDCIVFDMDSLIENIEEYHFEAWKKTLEGFFRGIGQPTFTLTGELYLAYLKHGKPFPSLLQFLSKQGISNLPMGSPDDSMEQNTLYGLFHRKLHHFRDCVRSRGLSPSEGALELLSELRQSGISVGCVTSSKNGHWLLNEVPQLASLVDCCLNGGDGEVLGLRWRPEMDYYSAVCKQLNSIPARTIVVMDGIDGFAKNSLEQFKLIVDLQKGPEDVNLVIPHLKIPNLKEVTLTLLNDETANDLSSSRPRRSYTLSRSPSFTEIRPGLDNRSLST
ncbi:putative glycosyl hydrolase [Trypanosoma grayi]|uniref:putative glycosyl hydrolase n=1 Tax=Trypanosoma grayi TaxID=71804 RepID=UPI0004F40937|nr:putative glycosyl hydrolase [Trypanosoma grayi]KEG09965.1 putative glycosyl hydrolase [Trypanosoma grayi]